MLSIKCLSFHAHNLMSNNLVVLCYLLSYLSNQFFSFPVDGDPVTDEVFATETVLPGWSLLDDVAAVETVAVTCCCCVACWAAASTEAVGPLTATETGCPAVDDAAAQAGLKTPYHFNLAYHKTRKRDFFPLLREVIDTLNASDDVIVHCHAGRHRAALFNALVQMFANKYKWNIVW